MARVFIMRWVSLFVPVHLFPLSSQPLTPLSRPVLLSCLHSFVSCARAHMHICLNLSFTPPLCNPWNHRDPFGLFLLLVFSFCCRGTQHFTGTVSNEATSEMGYPAWPAGRTCEFSFLSAWHEAKPRTSLGRQVRPSSLCRFVVALRLWPLFLLRPPGSDGPYWYS